LLNLGSSYIYNFINRIAWFNIFIVCVILLYGCKYSTSE